MYFLLESVVTVSNLYLILLIIILKETLFFERVIILDVRFIQRKGIGTLAVRASERMSSELNVLHSYTL